jgi:hypothetical protein
LGQPATPSLTQTHRDGGENEEYSEGGQHPVVELNGDGVFGEVSDGGM